MVTYEFPHFYTGKRLEFSNIPGRSGNCGAKDWKHFNNKACEEITQTYNNNVMRPLQKFSDIDVEKGSERYGAIKIFIASTIYFIAR